MWTGAGQYQGKADSTIYIQLIHYLHGNASNHVFGVCDNPISAEVKASLAENQECAGMLRYFT